MTGYVTKRVFLLSMLCWLVALATTSADVLDDLKAVKIGGRKYVGMQVLYIVNDIEERGNEALAKVGKDGFSIRMGGMMGGAAYLFRDIDLPPTSIYDAISRIASTANCTVSAEERTFVVEPRGEAVDEAACIDKIALDARHYTSEPLTNIMNDVWRRTNDMLFKTTRRGIIVDYPHIETNLSICIPATNAQDAFKLVAKCIKADVSFDGYLLDVSISEENTEIARLLKSIHIDDLSIPSETRFYDGMESLRRQINLRCARSGGESVKFEYCGAQTNLPIAAVHLADMSAFEAVSNICFLTRRSFSCCATGRTVSIGLEMEEFTSRFMHLRFQGGRFSGNDVFSAFRALLSAINANLERNDMLTVGAAMSGLQSIEKPLCIEIQPCTTWEAFEQFARITNRKVSWVHSMVRFRSADGTSNDESMSGKHAVRVTEEQ